MDKTQSSWASREEEGWLREAAGLSASTATPSVQEELYGWIFDLMDWEGWWGGAVAFHCANKSTVWETLNFYSGSQFHCLSSSSPM